MYPTRQAENDKSKQTKKLNGKRNYKQENIMRLQNEEKCALERTVTAICITAMALICLVLAAGCTNDLTVITENR